MRVGKRFGGAALVCASLYGCVTPQQQSNKPLQIVSIDVEGGAAVLFVTPEGKSLLIDTGWPAGMGGARRPVAGGTAPAAPAPASAAPSSADRIVAVAQKAGLRKLDFVLITHYHVDHVGGFSELIGKFPVDTILDHGPNRETPRANAPASATQPVVLYPAYEKLIANHRRQSLKPGDKVQIGSLTLTTVASDGEVLGNPLPGAGQANPDCVAMTEKPTNGGEENARSVGVLMTYGSARVVSLGDLTWNVEKALVCPVNKVGSTDLLLVSHHGSNLSNSPALVHALTPRVAIMNNGAQKGGDPETYDTVSTSTGLQRLWQLHFATKGGAARNPAEPYIANLTDDPDQHSALHISVFPDGRLMVLNERTGFSESYPSNTNPPSK